MMKKLYFDTIRLGFARSEMSEVEPFLRDSDMVSLDINAIKQADAPGHATPSVNGFYGEEACQLAKYAGLSDRLSCFCVFEINPNFDVNNQTVELAAQIIWHFVQGFYLRQKDFPVSDLKKYIKFIVNFEKSEQKLIFYKSPKTERWWIEIPYEEKNKEKKLIIPCSYQDYFKATRQEIPDKWWKYFQKLN